MDLDYKVFSSSKYFEAWTILVLLNLKRILYTVKVPMLPLFPLSVLNLKGGTNADMAPQIDEFTEVCVPNLAHFGVQAALWNLNYFLRFRFLLLKSYGSGFGSDFWKSYGSGSRSYFWKITVPVPVPTFEKLRFRFWFGFQLRFT